MTEKEAVEKLNCVANETVNSMAGLMLGVASSAATLIKKRIKDTGTNAEGQAFAPYSTNPMKAWYNKESAKSTLTDNAYALAKQRYKRKRPSKKPLVSFTLQQGYKEYRELHGHQTAFVDFAFSGNLWSNVQVISSDAEHSQGTARISAMGDNYRKILSGNTERKGVILDLNDKEVEELNKQVEKWITGIFHNCGL